jgi:uncharacterized protein
MKNRRKLEIGAALVLAAVVTMAAVTYGQARRLITNPAASRKLPTQTPAAFQLPFVEIAITNKDGLKLVGWFIPSTNSATILAQHGYKSTRAEMLPAARILHRHGYNVLIPSIRAHDYSEGERITFGIREVQDLAAWYEYVVKLPGVDPARLGMLGNSMGGSLVIQFAAQNPHIKAVATDSAFSSLSDTVSTSIRHFTGLPAFPFAPMIFRWAEFQSGCSMAQVDAKAWISQISPRPVLLMQGGADTHISPKSGEWLYRSAAEPKELWSEPAISHARFATDAPGYEQRLTAFFDKYLLP